MTEGAGSDSSVLTPELGGLLLSFHTSTPSPHRDVVDGATSEGLRDSHVFPPSGSDVSPLVVGSDSVPRSRKGRYVRTKEETLYLCPRRNLLYL